MTLAVPLTVRIGDDHVTQKLKDLSFRREAVGGLQSISVSFDAPLSTLAVATLEKVYLFDARTAETIGEARVADLGRSASADGGQTWEIVAFGPAQHASDIMAPAVYVDQSITDGWRQVDRVTKGATWSQSTRPGSTTDAAAEAQVFQFPQGLTVGTSDEVTSRYERVREAGMKLGRLSVTVDGGANDTDYQTKVMVRTAGAGGGSVATANLSTASANVAAVVVTDWANGRNGIDLKFLRAVNTGAVANDNRWASFSSIVVRTLLLNQDGTEITTGYTQDYVLAHEVVEDLLGRRLPEFDGAGAIIDTSGTFQIDSLVYVDGVSPKEIFDDLMLLEPAFYWTTGPDTTGNGYAFEWKEWPTSVRYEATLEDGGNFPASAQELYNEVLVRYRDKRGRTRSLTVTGACPMLDAAGLTRRAEFDVGDEIHTPNGAQRVGDNFLAAHKYPPNAGTLSIARPIRDLTTGQMVQPFEIEAGELIRVYGIESFPDSLNASSNDGQTVFRIWAMNYASASNTAQLELDTYPRSTAAALAALQNRRTRKR